MEWRDEGLVVALRPYGEHDAIATLFTSAFGLRRGFVHGGQGRRQRAVWQVGHLLALHWRARRAEGLGTLGGELIRPIASLLLSAPLRLALLAAACALLAEALAEGEPHERLFATLRLWLEALPDAPPEDLCAAYVRWELLFLADLGFGLDLSRCALTGAREGLAYVSPRSGRAVTAEAALPWRERLLPLPPFLATPPGGERDVPVPLAESLAGLQLTGHFLGRFLFAAHHRPLPKARLDLYERLRAAVEAAPAAGS